MKASQGKQGKQRVRGGQGADRVLPGRRELVLAVLRSAAGPMDILAIAGELSVHPNTVRFHLDALVSTGRVERLPSDVSGPGRPPILYRASREMDRNGPSNYRLLATMLTSHVADSTDAPAQVAVELGRSWGPSLTNGRPEAATETEALTAMVEILDELGFAPEPYDATRSKQIQIRNCPFLSLVDEFAELICPMHLGLMQGALTALGAPITVDRLDPFVEPDLCSGHLTSVRSS